jgi:hypothetical protein
MEKAARRRVLTGLKKLSPRTAAPEAGHVPRLTAEWVVDLRRKKMGGGDW